MASMAMNLSKLQEMVKDREAWHAAVHVVIKNWTQRSNWIIMSNKGTVADIIFLWSLNYICTFAENQLTIYVVGLVLDSLLLSWSILTPILGFSRWERIHLQWRRCKRRVLDPWVGKITWNSKWHPIPVFLPEKFHGQRNYSPWGYSPWGHERVRHDWAHSPLFYLYCPKIM